MTLPVSSYEALLVQVRELTHETILLQRQLSSDLYRNVDAIDVNHNHSNYEKDNEQEMLVHDNLVIGRRDKKIDTVQRSLVDRNEFAFHPHLKPSLDSARESSFNSGELTARLIAWRDQNCRGAKNEDESTLQRPKQSDQTGIPCTTRLGLEGSGGSSLLSWDSGASSTREGTIVRPYYAAGDPPLSRERTTAESQSIDRVRTLPTTLIPRSAESRCFATRISSRDQHQRLYDKAHDNMEAESKDDETNSGSPSPELYTRNTKCYDEDGSSEEESKHDDGLQAHRLSSLYHGTWPVKKDLWTNQQMSHSGPQCGSTGQRNDMASVMSFSSSTGVSGGCQGHSRLGAKVDVVYSLLGMLGSTEGREDMSSTLLAMSNSIESCLVMRQSGCLPLLVQLIHAPAQDLDTRERAARALHNVIHARSDEKVGRREARVLRLLEQLRDYCQALRASLENERPPDDLERHPGPTIAALMKLSFDEAHRLAMCQLGGLHAVAELIEMDHAAHGGESDDQSCITLRRYAGMALTNLTFGDGNNKALLCSFRAFMRALVSQLRSLSDDLRQVTASVLRNLSWRADSSSKQTLREVGAVTGLMKAAMEGRKESTLKSILSALWNLSAHCSTNKVDICAVEGALAFLVDMLTYKAPSKTLSIVENAGGILRNVSSHIAVREDYRAIVRERGCLQVLLRQLRSPSLTVVSNACGALWNLSARCPHDQRLLWDLGAVPMLRSLVHSKHKMISMGSSAALKNLLSARPAGSNLVHLDSTARGLGLSTLPTLVARRQRALEQEIDQNLAETCDNIEPSTSPTNKDDKFSFKVDQNFVDIASRGRFYHQSIPSGSKQNSNVPRSESRESMRSVTSTHSDTIFERVNRHLANGLSPMEIQIKQQSSSLHSATGFNCQPIADCHNKKYALRYKNSIPERLRPTDLGINEIADFRSTNSTISWATAPDQESACSQIFMGSSLEDNFSPTGSTKLSLASGGCQKKISPIGNLTLAPNLEAATINHREEAKENIQSPTLSQNSDDDLFNVYAETDIDQPTNYSLRYAEHNSDEDEKQSSGYFVGTEQDIEDTVKTYYTEGTPYETPLTSSGAASDNDVPDSGRGRPLSQKIFLGRINDVARETAREQTIPIITTEERSKSLTDAANDITGLPNCLGDSDVNKSSESSIVSETVINGCQASACQPEPIETTFVADTTSSIDTVASRFNSLLLNDEPKIMNDTRRQNVPVEGESFPESMVSDGDDDDEDLLAACIHIGMQNNRHRQSFRRNSLEKTPPAESNLARYQTSTALNQVETNGFTEQSECSSQQSEPQRFDIKITTTRSSTNDNDSETVIHGYQSFEENFNIAKDDEKITVEYQKFEEYSSNEIAEENVEHDSWTKPLEIGANSEEENETIRESSVNQELRDSESMESFDSVERSEQALLQFCLKSGTSKHEENLSNDSNDVFSCTTEAATTNSEDSSKSRVTVTEAMKLADSKRVSNSREPQSKNEDEYRRQRDPDAMIASLDRLTATLVQQTEAIRESSAMKQSVLSDTWNEDSPNDVSYPSISVSAPLIASFKSDMDEEEEANPAGAAMPTLREGENAESSTMTNSRIIEREAFRLAEAVSAEATRQQTDYDSGSLTSNDIETVRPPSTMNSLVSLTASYVGPFESFDASIGQSTSLSPIRVRQNPLDPRNIRKKSLPVGVMAKRALAHGINHAGSLESLLNDCSLGTNSQLENVKPPSMMDELFDTGDMENSMLSVASITSEIADSKDQESNSLTASDPIFDLVKPVANVLSITCMRYAEMQSSGNDSISEYLENINPPSLFNELSEMDDSTVEANTETLCSDTLCIDVDLRTEEAPHPFTCRVSSVEQLECDTDEATTPIHTESCFTSSAESTPTKKRHKNHLTPKQKRQLAKERYKTYTIAAELVKKEEEERRKQEAEAQTPRGKLSPYSKLTPKQRRQEDRARFQTQVLDNPDFAARINEAIKQAQENPDGPSSPAKTSIPTLNLCGGRTFRKKRVENKENNDRYRTRTLNDAQTNAGGIDSLENGDEIRSEIASEAAMQTMLERNANIVLHTLNETGKVPDPVFEDRMLDCETLSLVSNDSEPDHSLRNRCSIGLGNKLVTNQNTFRKQEESLEYRASDVQVATRVETPEISESESENDFENAEEECREPKRPRIIKPGTVSRDRSADSNAAEKSEPGSPKAIRGRRRALYSNPNTRKTTPQSSPLKQINSSSGIPIGRGNGNPVVRATRATTLRQNTNTNTSTVNPTKDVAKSNVTQKITQASSVDKKSRTAALAKRSSIPQRGSTYSVAKSIKRHSTPPGCTSNPAKEAKIEATPKPLERQGTFTKDEPQVENAPTVVFCPSPSKSKIAKPTKGSPTRSNPVAAAAGKSKISVRTYQSSQQSKLTKCWSVEKIQSPRVSPSLGAAKRIAPIEPTNAQTNPAEVNRTARRITSLGQRSNSNSSIVSSSAATSRKLPKEATSKIASLWKKVEESKNKQKYEKPDTRQWITAPTDPTESQQLSVANEPSGFRLFRSSTFEGVQQQSDDILPAANSTGQSKNFDPKPNGSKYRNSCDLTGMNPADAPCKIPKKFSDARNNGKETPFGYGTIVLRKQHSVDSAATTEIDSTKRISRLGSFFRVDSAEGESSENSQRTPVSAIVPPFHYNPRQELPISTTKTGNEDEDFDNQMEVVTGSARVTTV